MLPNTSFLRYLHDQQMSDTIETLDLPFLEAITEGLTQGLGVL